MPVPAASSPMPAADPYPRLAAATLGFRLGAPRGFTSAPDGSRVAFLRSPSGTDRRTGLWVYDAAAGTERLVADPGALLAAGEEDLSPQERARRERAREGAAGIVGYATDRAVRRAVFALSSRAFVADLVTGQVAALPTATPVIDPRPDPTGTRVAYVVAGTLRVAPLDGGDDRAAGGPGDSGGGTGRGGDRALAEPDAEQVTWGLAEFVAAEEMDRTRGFWWSPAGDALLVARVDESPVPVWHLADPAHPDRAPRPVRYPAAGTANADVSLWAVDLDGSRREIGWDRARFPYLAEVCWSADGPPLLFVLSRDQRTAQVLAADPAAGTTTLVREVRDDAWVDIVPGLPRWLPGGRMLTHLDDGDTRRLALDGEPVTPEGLQVGGVLDADEDGVLVSATTEPTQWHVYRLAPDHTLTRLSERPGVYGARAAGGLVVLAGQSLEHDGVRVEVLCDGRPTGTIASRQQPPPFTPAPHLLRLGPRELRTAVLFPRRRRDRRLPLLLAPYGGPHAQRVVRARSAYVEAQWLADQGFCVVITDGRGTPGRGPAWERQVRHDFVATLDDQVEAVAEIARRYPDDVDPGRVGIRGWSYGGYLAALAVLRRPDVFTAAVAGAPVTDWRLYDTCYTERYLGDPAEQPEVYERNGLLRLAALPPAGDPRAGGGAAGGGDPARREPALLILHGLVDDNVVVAHTLRLSAALLAAGRPHAVLPLSGVTHMTPQEVVAENRLRLELRFLHEALAR